MNKISLIIIANNSILGMIIALALIFGTACKKKIDTEAPNNLGEKVHITLKVNNGSKGVDPSTGVVTFENSDCIWVGTEDQYCGKLYYYDSEGEFSGDVAAVEGQYLYFYYVQGSFWEDPDVGEGKELHFDISDQLFGLPVLSCGRSNVKYNSEVTSYSCTLLNQCALVCIRLVSPFTNDMTLLDMPNKVTLNFEEHTITPTGETGDITLYGEPESDAEFYWATLLPTTDETHTAIHFGECNVAITIPALKANDYLAGEDAFLYDNEHGYFIDPSDPPMFSVSDTERVFFSSGNLQYKDGEGWRFAEHQWDEIGSWNTSDWVDLFGWGTWGYGKNPLNESTNGNDYQWSTDFQGELDGHDEWFTLSYEQWVYLITSHTIGLSRVKDRNGLVIRPDGNTTAVSSSYTAEAWADEEAAGSVFLPASGFRYGSDVDEVGSYGNYWSSSTCEYNESREWYFEFHYNVNMSNMLPGAGFSVRLVRPAE